MANDRKPGPEKGKMDEKMDEATKSGYKLARVQAMVETGPTRSN